MPPSSQPERRWLHHATPPWVRDATYFITLCCQERGRNQLCVAAISEKLLEAVRRYHEQGKWFAHLWLLMPDHAHALVSCPREEELTEIVSAWKRHTARNLKIVWQKGFFDHRLRSDESLQDKAHYIRMNPVRKGLVANAADWLHFWPR